MKTATDFVEPRKSKSEYFQDGINIAKAMLRTIKYSIKISPLNTAGVVITTIILAVIPFLNTWINSLIIDSLVSSVAQNQSDPARLIQLILFVLGLFVFRALINTLNRYTDTKLFFDFSREFGFMVTKKFAYLDMEYYESPETNTLITKVKENYGGRPLNFITQTFRIINILVTIVSAVSILILFSPKIVLLLLITTFPLLLSNIVFGRRRWSIWGAKGDIRRDYSMTRWKLSSSLSLQELRIFKVRKLLLDRVYKLVSDFQNFQISVENKRHVTLATLNTLGTIGQGVAYWIVIQKALVKIISIGQVGFYLATIGRLRGGFGRLFGALSRIYENGLFMVDMFEFLDLRPKVISGEVQLKTSLIESPPLIEFKNISFKYPQTTGYIFKNFNLTLKPGEHVAIVGENGAGKTTLIKLLMRFYDVNKGSIEINQNNLKDLDLENWYSMVGTLFQEFNTYHFDAKMNIGLGDPEKINNLKEVIKAAKMGGAHSFIQKYEHGYNQILDRSFEGGIRPSWGQWQRIALSRAFFKDAPVLILDEPTSAMDPKAEFEIFERLFEFAKGKSVIIISHRFSTVRNAKRILVLDKGKIIEEGSHNALMKIKGGIYKSAFEMQKKGYE